MALAGVGAFVEIREAGRYPDGRYDLLAAATGRFAIDSVDPGTRAVPGRRRHPARGRGRRRAAGRAAGGVRDPPVRPLPRADAGPRGRDGGGRSTSGSSSRRIGADDDDAPDDAIDAGEARGAGAADPRARGARPSVEDETLSARDLTIPDDPTVLSYLLSGIVQVELPRRQALLEAATTVERLEELISLLDREVLLLTRPAAALLRRTRRRRWAAPAAATRRYSLKRSSFHGSASLL